MKPVTYKQCRLIKKEGTTTFTRMLWLPLVYAFDGSIVKLKDNGTWVDGWVVQSASGPELSQDAASTLNRAHLKQRQASDI